MAVPAPLLTGPNQAKQRQLQAAKRRATALLAAVTAAFVAVVVLGGSSTGAGYAEATLAAAMVGGLADWFAVTALFRHPLGLPIPHTAIVVQRKDQFGETLGEFIRGSFLTPDSIVERVRAAAVVPRAAAWLATPDHAARVAEHVADAAVAVADVLQDDDIHAALEGLVRERLEPVPLAPMAGRALRFLTADGRHHPVLDAAIVGLDRYLDEHRDELHERLGQQSPWWLPGKVEDRIFERILEGARGVLKEMASDPDHPLRRDLEARLAQFATDLETSPDLRERGEQLKADVLAQPELRRWMTSLWSDAKAQLRAQAADPGSALRARLAEVIAAAGTRLEQDPVLAARASGGVEAAARYLAQHFDGEIVAMVRGTIARWDAGETSSRLELLLGPDLQYIRINGTVVGGAAGLVLHGVAQLLG